MSFQEYYNLEVAPKLTKELDVKANIWTFLYDSDSQEFFRTMGLLKDNEETSLAFEAWKNSN